MKTNNQKKSKNKIFIIWGLFIFASILVSLFILLLAIKPQSKTNTQNQPTLISKNNLQQEQDKTYNKLISKKDKKFDSLTKTKKRIRYRPDRKTIEQIDEYNENNKLIKKTDFNLDGKSINFIKEYDPQTGNMIKLIIYKFKEKSIDFIKEYDPQKGNMIKLTTFNPDGTVKEIINY